MAISNRNVEIHQISLVPLQREPSLPTKLELVVDVKTAKLLGFEIPLSWTASFIVDDALSMRFETLRYKRDPQNPLNDDAAGIIDLSGHR